MAGEAEFVPPVEPEETGFSCTGTHLFSLQHAFLMRVVACPAKNCIIYEGQINTISGLLVCKHAGHVIGKYNIMVRTCRMPKLFITMTA